MNKWYAVQFGDDYDAGYGSFDYDEAVQKAQYFIEDEKYEGLEVRIAIYNADTEECIDEIILRDGFRG